MRRRAGTLVQLEISIVRAAFSLHEDGLHQFHGYQIARLLADVSERKLLTAYGTLYRALGRLQKMGLVESRWEDPRVAAGLNRPGRRLYTLTKEGLAAARTPPRASRPQSAATRARKKAAPA